VEGTQIHLYFDKIEQLIVVLFAQPYGFYVLEPADYGLGNILPKGAAPKITLIRATYFTWYLLLTNNIM